MSPRHYRTPGPARKPMLKWTRELPIEGHPRDLVHIVDAYGKWLSTNPIPKLFINGDPAGFLIGPQCEFCRAWPNQQDVTVKGAHFLPEDSRRRWRCHCALRRERAGRATRIGPASAASMLTTRSSHGLFVTNADRLRCRPARVRESASVASSRQRQW